MSPQQRQRAIDSFTDDPEIPVFLVSLRCGGLGLNLTAATHAIIFDPWWNPSVEDQAVDRIHRLGQCRPVSVHHLIMRHSIEEDVLALQERKRKLIANAFAHENELDRQRVYDLQMMLASVYARDSADRPEEEDPAPDATSQRSCTTQ